MKKIVSIALSTALALSLSTSVLALPNPAEPVTVSITLGQVIHPNYLVDLAEKQEEAKIKAAYEADIAIAEESLKTLRDEIKAAREAKPVDKEALAELQAKEKEINDKIKALRDEMNKQIERSKLVVKFGEAAVAKIESLKAAFEKEELATKASKEEIKAQIDELLAAETVDTEKVDELRAAEKALDAELKTKRDALNKEIEEIKFVAEFGKAAADKIASIKADFAKEELAAKASKEEIKAQIDELLAAETVDKEKVDELRAAEKALDAELKAKRDAVNAEIEKIKLAAKYGEDVIAQVEKAKATYEENLAALNKSKAEVQEKLAALKEVKPVDKAAEAKLKEQEKELNDKIKAEKEAFDKAVEAIFTAPAK